MSVHIASVGGKDPFWGPQTAKMNFCEEDYHVSSYIGEFINTLTSLSYVVLGGYALYRQWKVGNKAEISHSLSYISLIFVGIGSAAYHASLKYPLQLVDDLSMLLGAAVMFHYVLTINSSAKSRFALFVAIVAMLGPAIWVHIKTGNSSMHQFVFFIMIMTVGFRTFKLLTHLMADRAMKSKLRRLGRTAYLTLVVAYGFWLADVFACPYLRSIRHFVGLPLAWVLELHGWWHIFTAIGVYAFMVIGEFLRPAHRTQALQPQDRWIDILKGPGLPSKGNGEGDKKSE